MTDASLFSRIVRVDALPREGRTLTIEANSEEKQALASFFKLPAIAALTATLHVQAQGRGGARVTGSVHGEVTQICVASLEPFTVIVDEDVDVRFVPERAASPRSAAAQEALTVSIDDDEPDPIVDGKVDLGALAAEFLALGLDPYPRKPGAVFESDGNSDPTDSPFSVLVQRDKQADEPEP
jgi:uncharacterized metal-binding protein YceD (DUF177 family)